MPKPDLADVIARWREDAANLKRLAVAPELARSLERCAKDAEEAAEEWLREVGRLAPRSVPCLGARRAREARAPWPQTLPRVCDPSARERPAVDRCRNGRAACAGVAGIAPAENQSAGT